MAARNRIAHSWAGTLGLLALAVWCGGAALLLAQSPPAPLFPEPFVVEHHLVQTEADGSLSETEPVRDYYGGSWIVSVRPDESRLVVDFARRETTEIRPAASTYSVLSFDRLAELRRNLRAAHEAAAASPAPAPAVAGASARRAGMPEKPVITVEEISPRSDGRPAAAAGAAAAAAGALVKLRVSARGGEHGRPAPPPIEVWCDRRVRLSERARGAIAELENEVLGDGGVVTAAAMVAAAREHTAGAFVVRTVRSRPAAAAGVAAGTTEDVTTRLAPIATFPAELLRIPEGYRRAPHALEVMAAYEEDEAALAARSRAATK